MNQQQELIENITSSYPTANTMNGGTQIVRSKVEKINRLFEKGTPMSKLLLEEEFGLDSDFTPNDDGNEGFTSEEVVDSLSEEELLEAISNL